LQIESTVGKCWLNLVNQVQQCHWYYCTNDKDFERIWLPLKVNQPKKTYSTYRKIVLHLIKKAHKNMEVSLLRIIFPYCRVIDIIVHTTAVSTTPLSQYCYEYRRWLPKKDSLMRFFDHRIFTAHNTPGFPDKEAKADLSLDSNSRRYSFTKIDSALCRRAKSYGKWSYTLIIFFYEKIRADCVWNVKKPSLVLSSNSR
jgi:hypothetical protein